MWKICLLGCLLLLVGVNASAQSGVDGIPQSILSEVRSAQVLPKGQYTESRTWGVECRLSWSGSTSLRIDRVTIYRFDGNNFPSSLIPMVPQPISPGRVKNIPVLMCPKHNLSSTCFKIHS